MVQIRIKNEKLRIAAKIGQKGYCRKGYFVCLHYNPDQALVTTLLSGSVH